MSEFPDWITLPPEDWTFYATTKQDEREACLIYEFNREAGSTSWLSLSPDQRWEFTKSRGLETLPALTPEASRALKSMLLDSGGPRAGIFSDLAAARLVEIDGISLTGNSWAKFSDESDVTLRLNLELPTELLLRQIRSALDEARKIASAESQADKLARTRAKKGVNGLLRCLSRSRLFPLLAETGLNRTEMTKEIGRVKVGADPLGGTIREWETSEELLVSYFAK